MFKAFLIAAILAAPMAAMADNVPYDPATAKGTPVMDSFEHGGSVSSKGITSGDRA